MLDRDLALIYGVDTKVLNQAVTRNFERFPADFMFELSEGEFESVQHLFELDGRGGSRYKPRAFTEQGVAMLSGILKSKRAVQVNIMVMRAFVKMRQLISEHKDLAKRLNALEKKYDQQFAVVFEAIRQMIEPPKSEKKKFGFRTGQENGGKKIEGRKR